MPWTLQDGVTEFQHHFSPCVKTYSSYVVEQATCTYIIWSSLYHIRTKIVSFKLILYSYTIYLLH